MIGNFVAIRRGILDHLKYGWLTPNEFTVFVILLLEADSSTGMNRTNAAGIRSLTGFTEDVSKNVLKSLQDKGYIYRHIIEGSRKFYRVWIHKYEVTTGKHKGLLTDISQTLISRDVNDIRYVDEAPEVPHDAPPEGTPDPPPVGQPDPPHYYKKPRHQDTETENARTQDNFSTDTSAASDVRIESPHVMQRQDAAAIAALMSDGDAASRAVSSAVSSARPANAGLVWDGEWLNAKDYGRLNNNQVDHRLATVDLRLHEGVYYERTSGRPLEWAEAYLRITGNPLPARSVRITTKEVNANVN